MSLPSAAGYARYPARIVERIEKLDGPAFRTLTAHHSLAALLRRMLYSSN
jgi:hypothetical protein